MAGTAFARSVVVSRAAVFFYLARPEGALQADGDWRGVGGAAAVDEHGRVHDIFWTAGEVAFGRVAISGFLFRGAGTLDVFFDGTDHGDERGGGQPARHYEGIFSAANPAFFERTLRTGGFWNCVCGAGRFSAGIRIASRRAGAVAAASVVAGAGDGAGNRFVAVRAECLVPGREVCNAVPGAVLDAGVAGGVSNESCAGEVAVAVRTEPDGWGD